MIERNRPALSIRQPWAELILRGQKTVETRSWRTDYRGPIWVHASKASTPELDRYFDIEDAFRGGFIGSMNLSGILLFDHERWEKWRDRHLDPGAFAEGTYAWLISDPIRFLRPIPGRGALNLFVPNKALQDQMDRAEDIAAEPDSSG